MPRWVKAWRPYLRASLWRMSCSREDLRAPWPLNQVDFGAGSLLDAARPRVFGAFFDLKWRRKDLYADVTKDVKAWRSGIRDDEP